MEQTAVTLTAAATPASAPAQPEPVAPPRSSDLMATLEELE